MYGIFFLITRKINNIRYLCFIHFSLFYLRACKFMTKYTFFWQGYLKNI